MVGGGGGWDICYKERGGTEVDFSFFLSLLLCLSHLNCDLRLQTQSIDVDDDEGSL